MAPKKVKGTTLNLKDFMGATPGPVATGAMALPTGPSERGVDDDGSFKRAPRRYDRDDDGMGRSDGGDWR
eukprot:CAMPEP_0113324412 /NCGR_PEP_ID=MMETSP0010_2-20120614/17017_1 /TAXON_ID=216773 ORGANISM="Corethron hystrix, Strain 308" /NCGR_SAMPLE_ID=MMETSP0010_2 /ASSEMBLY_ACC=CAM_ASM_000155 /LENGTH=69 /DNA_ID=CAMNT_0000183761 /DNA_START=56 /DNA_END=262 /DNA_ORIENTATION=+ /assembly_acc=CAM_ASM_000155